MNEVYVHPFEKTIGPGPYRFLGSFDMGAALAHQQAFGDTAAAFRDAPRLESGMGSCTHCGHPILNIQIIRRGDGKLYGVGSDCIEKIGDGKLVCAMKLEKNKKAKLKRAAKRESERLAGLAAEREKNGGLTNHEVWEKQRQDKIAAEELRLMPIKKELEPYAVQIEDGAGGFCDSMAAEFRMGRVPFGKAYDIVLDILAKRAGRKNSKGFITRREIVDAELREIRRKIGG